MQKGHLLEFYCISCKNPVQFSVFHLEPKGTICKMCQKKYFFNDEVLLRQLKKFEMLCRQLIESEEILSQTSIGISVGGHQVKIPYKLLLTRINSHLELMMGDQSVTITFRIEPLKDIVSILKRL